MNKYSIEEKLTRILNMFVRKTDTQNQSFIRFLQNLRNILYNINNEILYIIHTMEYII